MAAVSRPRVVVGVDAPPVSSAVLRWAARYAEQTRAELKVVWAWHVPTLPEGSPVRVAEELYETAVRAIEHEVARVLPGTDATVSVEQGSPVRVLLRAARDADLLVVGSRGQVDAEAPLLGSVSLSCVAHAPCPVVVVPQDGDTARVSTAR